MTTPRERVEAATLALAQQWAHTPHDIHALAKVLRKDAWTLERAGLLANPPKETP